MEMSEICEMQISDDERRGFSVKFDSDRGVHEQLLKDLVGLVGEVGEFSDLVKKVGLRIDNSRYDGPTLEESRERLGKELGDIVIYAIRLAAILGVDLESVLIETIRANKIRYEYLNR